MKTLRLGCGLLLFAGASYPQQYVISTFAGGAPAPTPVAALSASIGLSQGVATDAAGNVYFTSLDCVFKVDQNGVLTRVAGISRPGYSGDGGPAAKAQLYDSEGIAIDGSGNLFIADTTNYRVRKISTTGTITTVAGNGTQGLSGDGGPATSAELNGPTGVAVDASGNLFIAEPGKAIVRKVSATGIITTVAGNGTEGFSGDGGPATSAELAYPYSVAVDGSGNLYITVNNRIRKVSPTGTITTVAGNGTPGSSGDGGSATSAQLGTVDTVGRAGLAVDASGSLFIADTDNQRVRKVSMNGIITTVAGGVGCAFCGDGGPATSAGLYEPYAVAVDGSGNLFIADGANYRIRKVSANGIIATAAGNGTGGFSGDGGPATAAQLYSPQGVAVDGLGNVFIADADNLRVRKVSTNGVITTVAGNGIRGFASGDGGPALSAQLSYPSAVAVDASGNLFIADNYLVRKVSPSGIITTVAGNGTIGFSGDGGPATSAQLSLRGVAVDRSGNLFIADTNNQRIRKVSTNGIITTVAGNGMGPYGTTGGFSGDGGPATSAELAYPYGVAVDGSGNLFIADVDNHRVRMVSTDGIITTVAGTGIPPDVSSGDGGPATSAQLSFPSGVSVDGSGNLFIADNYRVRKISANGVISTIAGNGTPGFSGDGGPATTAQLSAFGVAVDGSGKIYVVDQNSFFSPDYDNNAIRLLTPTNQSILVSAVVDAASESAVPVSPGKIVVIYGGGLGPSELIQNQPSNGAFGTQLAGTTVSFNGTLAPMIYTSATQVAAIVAYGISGAATAMVTVSYQGSMSTTFSVPVAAAAPSLFTSNETGAGQIAAPNAATGVLNDAAHPAKAGDFLELFATGEGQTSPAGADGKLAIIPYPAPNLPVSVTVGGIPTTVTYAGGAPGEVAGLMQINVQIPSGVQPGGYVPVVLKVGNASTVAGAVWIAVSGN